MPRALTQDEIEDFRGSLCGVAARLFAERGVEGVTLRAIASELGCSPMTPYRYFENKEAIFHAVRMAGFREFGRRVEAAAADHADPEERFRALARAYIGFALDEPHAYRTMFQLDPGEDELEPHEHATVRGTWAPLLGTIRELIAAGRIEGDPDTLAHLAWVMMHGAVTLHLSQKLIFGPSLDVLIEPMCEMFLRGSAARPIAGE